MTNKVIEINGAKYFKCKKCGEVKPLNKCYFHINTMFSTGFNSKCKSCVKEERDSKPKVKYITRAELEEENKNLKKELELVRKNTRANVETLDNMYGELVDLKKDNEELQRDLEHRDSFFSIMRDVLANETITNNEIAMITYCVVHEECGDYDLSKKELEVVKKFWNRDYI